MAGHPQSAVIFLLDQTPGYCFPHEARKYPWSPGPPPATPINPNATIVEDPTAGPSSVDQAENLKRTLIDLKIKKANLSKMALDWDMQELSGEITSQELEEKKSKLVAIEQRLDDQINQLQSQLDSL